jgi:hypothetical protein
VIRSLRPAVKSEGPSGGGPSRLRIEETLMNVLHRHTRRMRVRLTCQRCGKQIPPVARKHRDPFCSRVCAEATYGTQTRRVPARMVIGGLPIRTP